MSSPAEELALMGRVKGVKVVLGKKFALKTLDSDEEDSAQSSAALFDMETRKQVLKKEKLARAIETIDGISFSLDKDDQEKGVTVLQKARQLIYKWQPPVVNRVYEELVALENQRESALKEIEKNATSPATSSGAGR